MEIEVLLILKLYIDVCIIILNDIMRIICMIVDKQHIF